MVPPFGIGFSTMAGASLAYSISSADRARERFS
jgi:hypothetical protein